MLTEDERFYLEGFAWSAESFQREFLPWSVYDMMCRSQAFSKGFTDGILSARGH